MSDTQTLTIGYRRNVGGTKFIIGIAILAASALALEEGAYTFSDEDVDEHLEDPTEVRGKKNSASRLGKLIVKHDGAVDLLDTEAVTAAINGESLEDPTDDESTDASDGDGASDDSGGSDAKADAKPKKGAKAPAKPKEELTGDDKKLADLGFNKKQRERISDEGKALVFEWSLEASAVSVMADGAVRIFRTRLAEDHPLVVKEAGEKEAAKAKKAEERAAAKAERDAANARPPKTFKVYVTHPDWVGPDEEGKTLEEKRGQRYLAGDNASTEEAERVAQVWRDAEDSEGNSFGFEAVVVPDTRSNPKNNLWDGPIEVPCVSKVPGDLWVGDHLGPHLRALNLSFKEYIEEYGLPEDTPKCTNRARASLAKAHAAVRRTHAMRIGQMCVAVGGDSVATVLQISAADGEGEDTKYTLQKVTGNDPELADDEYTWTHREIIDKTKPINRWSASAKKAAAAS